jgi:histidine triad (HIT) family protein
MQRRCLHAQVIGDGVPHLHVHLLPRYPGTPRKYWWTRVDQWPQALRGGIAEIEGLVRDLRGYLADGRDELH